METVQRRDGTRLGRGEGDTQSMGYEATTPSPDKAGTSRKRLPPFMIRFAQLHNARRLQRHQGRPALLLLKLVPFVTSTLSHGGVIAVDSLSRSCSGVSLSTSHQRRPSGQGTPRRP